MQSAHPNTDFLCDLARHAGLIMLKHFNLERNWTLKDDSTPLTEADTLINELVIRRLKFHHPHISVLGEEASREVADPEYVALCDPVDGTSPFSLGIPVSAFCLSILKGDEPVAGVIYDPFQDRMWSAVKGEGAVLNRGKHLHVSSHGMLKDSNVMLVKWRNCGFNLPWVEEQLMEAGAKVQNITSLAYFGGLIASGTVEASIFPGKGALETAAMQIIVEEAGGRVTDLKGEPILYKSTGYQMPHGSLVTNGHIHDNILEFTDSPFVPE